MFKDWEGRRGPSEWGRTRNSQVHRSPSCSSLFCLSLSISLPYSSFLPVPSSSSPPTHQPSFYPLTSSPQQVPDPDSIQEELAPALPSQLKGALKQEDPGQPAGPSHRSAFPLHLGLGLLPHFYGIESEHFKDGQGEIWGGG